MPSKFELESVKFALEEMFKGRNFNICILDNCMKILGVPPNPDYKALSLYHCVNWGDMPLGKPQEIMNATLRLLLGGHMDIEKLEILFSTHEKLKLESLEKDTQLSELKKASEEMEAKLKQNLEDERSSLALLEERLKVHDAKRGILRRLLG